MKYAWIREHTKDYPIAVLCRFMRVSRSSYYDWCDKPKTDRELENGKLTKLIQDIFDNSRQTYGTRRIKKELQAKHDYRVSRRRIGKLMKEAGLFCKMKRRFKATTDSKHNLPVAPNLLDREFSVSEPNRYFVGDITYLATTEGWLYLAVVIDLFSRQVVGWSMEKHMRAELVNNALLMAIFKRKPEKGLVWHTDRGSQYASDSHRKILSEHGIIQSMSRKGNCYDNAVAESFFHSLKTELTYHCRFETREQARRVIFEYIEVFYNRERLHSSNDYLSPVDYEIQNAA